MCTDARDDYDYAADDLTFQHPKALPKPVSWQWVRGIFILNTWPSCGRSVEVRGRGPFLTSTHEYRRAGSREIQLVAAQDEFVSPTRRFEAEAV